MVAAVERELVGHAVEHSVASTRTDLPQRPARPSGHVTPDGMASRDGALHHRGSRAQDGGILSNIFKIKVVKAGQIAIAQRQREERRPQASKEDGSAQARATEEVTDCDSEEFESKWARDGSIKQ
eukprot:scaffold57310_cov35-Tisochrysis_lutea.AAC.3